MHVFHWSTGTEKSGEQTGIRPPKYCGSGLGLALSAEIGWCLEQKVTSTGWWSRFSIRAVRVYIKFIGTHAEYDLVNLEEV